MGKNAQRRRQAKLASKRRGNREWRSHSDEQMTLDGAIGASDKELQELLGVGPLKNRHMRRHPDQYQS